MSLSMHNPPKHPNAREAREAITSALFEAAETGTTQELMDALHAYFVDALLVRHGEVVTFALSIERGANLAQAIGAIMRTGR